MLWKFLNIYYIPKIYKIYSFRSHMLPSRWNLVRKKAKFHSDQCNVTKNRKTTTTKKITYQQISMRAILPVKTNKSSTVAEMGDRLSTMDMGRKMGGCCAPFRWGAGSPSNTMSPGTRPTSVPSGILIHQTVWPQCTNVTDRQTERQTVRQTDNGPISTHKKN